MIVILERFLNKAEKHLIMVSGNLVSRPEVAQITSQDEIDRYVIDNLGLSSADISRIRSHTRMRERVFEAARALKLSLEGMVDEGSLDPLYVSRQFTTFNLGLLIKDDSLKSSPDELASNVVRREYKERRDERQASTGMLIPSPQFLREDCGVYQGNLYEAHKVWSEKGGFTASPDDWLRSIRIPLEIGLDEAIFLGVSVSQGSLRQHESEGDYHSLELWGRDIDFQLYREVVLPGIRRHFNEVATDISEQRNISRTRAEEEGRYLAAYDYDIPGLSVVSLSVATWLHRSLNFSADSSARTLPPLETDLQRYGLFMGLFAGDCNIYLSDKPFARSRRTEDADYLEAFKVLAESLDFNPYFAQDGTALVFNREDISRIFREGAIVNPYHTQTCKALVPGIVDRPNKFHLLPEQLRLLSFLHAFNVQPSEIESYLGIGERTIHHHLCNAEQAGFAYHRRKPGKPLLGYRPIDDILALYDKEPPKPAK